MKADSYVSGKRIRQTNPAEAKEDHLLFTIMFYVCFH